MKRKYKIYILIYTLTITTIVSPFAMHLIIVRASNPNERLMYILVSLTSYMMILLVGNRYIAKMARNDHPKNESVL